jgi:hypothetical protein
VIAEAGYLGAYLRTMYIIKEEPGKTLLEDLTTLLNMCSFSPIIGYFTWQRI